jgi:hypothetical protein
LWQTPSGEQRSSMARMQRAQHSGNELIRENVRHAAEGPARAEVAGREDRASVAHPPSMEGEAEGWSCCFVNRLPHTAWTQKACRLDVRSVEASGLTPTPRFSGEALEAHVSGGRGMWDRGAPSSSTSEL